jgi:hypothetical protein
MVKAMHQCLQELVKPGDIENQRHIAPHDMGGTDTVPVICGPGEGDPKDIRPVYFNRYSKIALTVLE